MEIFNQDELSLCKWQYTISHNNPNDFKIGEIVFLKSNPDYELVVCAINENTITVMWNNFGHKTESNEFPPQCILQYKYASLLTYDRKFLICIN
jgi:hypothetical protein